MREEKAAVLFDKIFNLTFLLCFSVIRWMDFMPGKGEHETGIFCHFYERSGATSWRYVHVNVMSHININKFKMLEQRLCS